MDVKIFRINYKSDFILTLNSDAGWMTPFCIKFWTGAPSQAYFAGYDGTTYTHCAPVEGDPTKLLVQFDDHHLPIGELKFQIGYHFTVDDFPTSVEDEVLNQASVIIEVDGEPAQVMLDLNGETAPEIEFSLPAYANEAQRIANEQQRIANEEQRISNEEARIAAETVRQQNEEQRIEQETARVNEFARLKRESEQATSDASAAATLANEKAQLAADKAALAQAAATLANEKAQLATDKAALAQAAATLANEKAALAQQKAEYAQTQGDYAKEQGTIAEEDHTRAEQDHERAESDHAALENVPESVPSTSPTDLSSNVEDVYLKNRSNNNPQAPRTLARLVTDTAKNRPLNESLTRLVEYQSLGFPAFSTSVDYAEGDPCFHDRRLYKAKAGGHSAGTWNAAHFEEFSVKEYTDAHVGIFDVSANNGGAVFASLQALLSDANLNTLIPAQFRRGGITITFVQGENAQSYDNNSTQYVQYMYNGTSTASADFTNISNWEKTNLEEDVEQLKSNETIIPADAITSMYPNDLDFSDENNNIIVEFRNGHVRTKNFDSSKDATLLERGLMSASDKAKVENSDTKLATIEEGAEVNDTDLLNSLGNEDLNISDEEGNMIAMFKGGHIKTKNFDSSVNAMSSEDRTKLNGIESGAQKNDVDTEDNEEIGADFDVVDDNDNIILSVINGWPKTKKFSGKQIYDAVMNMGLPEWSEEWSRMPKMEDDNPLAKVRYDGGMCRIFKKWGFIGDSLCSGTMNGWKVTDLQYTPVSGKAISNGSIVDDPSSVASDNITLAGSSPAIRLIFASNTGLNGKVLVAKYESGSYTALNYGTGSTNTEYTVYPTEGDVIAVSYPSDNVPTILYSVGKSQLVNYDLSWGQQMMRLLGTEGYNFSRGGEYAKRWCLGVGGTLGTRDWGGAQQTENLKDAYIIALGVNDDTYWFQGDGSVVDYPPVTAYPNKEDYTPVPTLTVQDVMSDVDFSDYTSNANSYAGWYAGIIQRLKSVRPDAYIFCVTLPAGGNNAYNQVIRILNEQMNAYYNDGTIWLIDLAEYNPITPEMFPNIYNSSHLTAFGYLYFAYVFSSYIDWIIRHNVIPFKKAQFIGTDIVAERFDDSKKNIND